MFIFGDLLTNYWAPKVLESHPFLVLPFIITYLIFWTQASSTQHLLLFWVVIPWYWQLQNAGFTSCNLTIRSPIVSPRMCSGTLTLFQVIKSQLFSMIPLFVDLLPQKRLFFTNGVSWSFFKVSNQVCHTVISLSCSLWPLHVFKMSITLVT